MDFWNDDNDTTACDICGKDGDGDNIGQGSYNEYTKMFSFYLCPICAAANRRRQAEKDAENQRRTDNAIAMHMTMS